MPGGKTGGETWIIKSAERIIKHERLAIKVGVVVCGVIVAGMLIGFWQYGIDLSAVFLGTPWGSLLHEQTRGIRALEGAIVAVTLLFGGLFLAGVIALVRRNGKAPEADKAE